MRRTAARGVEAVWRGVASAAAGLGRWKPHEWRSAGGQRVLVVAPHPDDEIGCGGTMLLHRHAGDEIHLVHVTDGRGSRAAGLGPDEMAERRRVEAGAAARALSLEPGERHWLGLREWEWDEAALVATLRDLLQRLQPHIIYAPSCVDFHPEHTKTARSLAQALSAVQASPAQLRIYQIQVPLTPLLANLLAPIAAVADDLTTVARCYRSQLGSIERCLRMKRYGGSLYGRAGWVEEFWQLDQGAYQRLHATTPVGGRFRALRARPTTDPLSYLFGLGARRALRDGSEQ